MPPVKAPQSVIKPERFHQKMIHRANLFLGSTFIIGTATVAHLMLFHTGDHIRFAAYCIRKFCISQADAIQLMGVAAAKAGLSKVFCQLVSMFSGIGNAQILFPARMGGPQDSLMLMDNIYQKLHGQPS